MITESWSTCRLLGSSLNGFGGGDICTFVANVMAGLRDLACVGWLSDTLFSSFSPGFTVSGLASSGDTMLGLSKDNLAGVGMSWGLSGGGMSFSWDLIVVGGSLTLGIGLEILGLEILGSVPLSLGLLRDARGFEDWSSSIGDTSVSRFFFDACEDAGDAVLGDLSVLFADLVFLGDPLCLVGVLGVPFCSFFPWFSAGWK